LFTDKDNLYAKTSGAVYLVPTNPQVLNSSEASVYVGAAEVFSIPPRRIATPDYYYGGGKERFSLISTEFGTVYTSADSGKIFHLSDKLEEISNKGMRQFFKENLPLQMEKYMLLNYQTEYPIKSTSDINGIGFTACYDPQLRKYVLHKKDYLPINGVQWDGERFYTTNASGGKTYRPFTDTNYFENKSFTISYSFVLGK